MTSNKDNIIFEKTSFLQGSNSPFIKELYLKYLDNPKSIPESWVEFFDGLDEDQDTIKKEILGPSWSPEKNNHLKTNLLEKDLIEDKHLAIEAPDNPCSLKKIKNSRISEVFKESTFLPLKKFENRAKSWQ